MAYSKESIKDSMVRTAARLWGVADNEIETNFDPLVLLMIEACAAEMEKIGYDISTSHTRLLDRLAELVIPESLMGAQPASCIVHAQPAERTASIDSLSRFHTSQAIKKNGNGSTANIDFFFTPAGSFLLYKAGLAWLFSGNKLFRTADAIAKSLVFGGDNKSPSDEIWLALAVDSEIKSLDGLSIYFDLRSHSESATFYNSLAGATAWINDRPVELTKGYHNNGQFELDPAEMLVSGQDYSKKINRQVAYIYRNRFIALGGAEITPVSTLPEKWQKLPDALQKQLAAEPLVFIKIKLTRSFSQEVLDGLNCSINAFPVVNRKLNTIDFRTDEWVNIIPLPVEGYFLDLNSITGSNGGHYKFRAAAERTEINEGEALVRSSGIGKTSSREVREMTANLTEAIRDQSAYFSELSNEFILGRLREISQILARLEDHMAVATDKNSVMHYVLLKPSQTDDVVTVYYWTTHGTDAHQLKTGTQLTLQNNAFISSKNVYTVTRVTGGKDGVTESEKKSLLKQQLVSRGKIISVEDVKLLVSQIFSGRLKKVEVKKGVQVSNEKNAGFSRTIDVIITTNTDNEKLSGTELAYLCREVEYNLEAHASPVYPFRVIADV